MARKPGAKVNRRTTPPENRRSVTPAPRVPWASRIARVREPLRALAARHRRAAQFGLGTLVFSAALAGLAAAAKVVERHVHTSPVFATQSIDVHGAVHLSHDEVARAAGLAVGKNVFEVGPGEAQAVLQREPWIETASVQRRLPATYRIEIKERRAVALLALDALYLVGDDGFAFKALGAGDPADLPIITGLAPEQVQHERRASATAVVAAVTLLTDYQDAGLLRKNPVSEIHVEDDGSFSLYVGADPTYVRLGKAPFRSKLRRLHEVFSQLGKEKASAAYVYLDNDKRPDRVTVRLR